MFHDDYKSCLLNRHYKLFVAANIFLTLSAPSLSQRIPASARFISHFLSSSSSSRFISHFLSSSSSSSSSSKIPASARFISHFFSSSSSCSCSNSSNRSSSSSCCRIVDCSRLWRSIVMSTAVANGAERVKLVWFLHNSDTLSEMCLCGSFEFNPFPHTTHLQQTTSQNIVKNMETLYQ